MATFFVWLSTWGRPADRRDGRTEKRRDIRTVHDAHVSCVVLFGAIFVSILSDDGVSYNSVLLLPVVHTIQLDMFTNELCPFAVVCVAYIPE